MSDYFDIQADLLQMNIYNIERNENIEPDSKKKIVEKQSKIVSIFINISVKEADNKTKSNISSENIKFNADKHSGDIDIDKSVSVLF